MAAVAATTLPFFLISLLVLFISCSHIIYCFAIATSTLEGQGLVPSSVTPKAAAVHYWHLKIHSNKPVPPIFLSKLSPFSPSEMITTNVEAMSAMSNKERPYDKYASQERPYDKYAAQERPYDKYASEERRPYDKYAAQERPYDKYASGERRPYDKYASEERPYDKYAAQERPYDKYASEERPYDKYASRDRHATASNDAKRATKHYNFNSHNNIKMATGDEVKEKTAEQNDPQGIFFRESDLKEGKTIPSLKFAGRGSGQYFLPRSIASKIPFYVSTVSKIFNIPTDSAMYRAIENAMSHCKMPPNTGETSQCVTSAEDMTDYAVSTLGANTDIKVWSTHNSSGFGGKGLIGKVKVVYDGELMAKQHLACHQVTFPYLVYHCHTVSNTRVYDMEILDVETKEKINQGVALCHLDTSAWNSDHMSFAALGTTPGMTEVCHWIHPWDMTWTAGDVAE